MRIQFVSLAVLACAASSWGAVATIGDTEYDTLTAACAAATDGQTVTLLQNVSENPYVKTACTVDLGGFTVSGCIYGQYNTKGGVCTIKNGTLKNGFDGAPGFSDAYPNGAMVFENVTMNADLWTDNHPVIVRGGTITGKVHLGTSPFIVENGTFNGAFDHNYNGKYGGTVLAQLRGGTFTQNSTSFWSVADGYELTQSGSTYTVTAVPAARAIWTGAAGDGSLSTAGNWSCVDATGAAVADAVPSAAGTTLCLAGETAFSFPAGTTPLWKSVSFMPLTDAPADMFGYFKRSDYTKYWKNASSESVYGQPDTDFVNFPLNYLNYVGGITMPDDFLNDTWKENYMHISTARVEGWFYVTAAQAGWWVVSAGSDDYSGFAVDDVVLAACATYTARTTGDTCYVAAGWHKYRVVVGDTWGGWSASNPIRIAINGASEIVFNGSNFTIGGTANTVTLTADCDWRGLGTLTFPAGLTLDLNGHNLAIAGATGTFKGGATISGSGTVTVDGGTFDDNGITASAATMVFTNSVVAKATWTGAGAADNVNDPANWSCTDADGHTVAGGVPGTSTVVSFDSAATTLQLPAGQTLTASYLQPTTDTLTLGGDVDWRGALTTSALPADFDGVRIPYLDAPKGSFINTGFKPNGNTHVAMDVTVQSTGEYWFGAWNTSNHKDINFSLCNDGSAVYVAYQYQNFGEGSALGNGRHLLELDRDYYLVDGVLTVNRLHASFQLNYPLYLFAQNRAGTVGTQSSQGTIRFHECWIYDNGTLVRHFVPVRKTDGTVGAYDLVNSAFYANGDSSTTFTGGVDGLVKTQTAFLPTRPVDLAGHTLALASTASTADSVCTVGDTSSGTPGELHLHVTPAQTFAQTTFTFSGNTKVVFETAGADFELGTKLCSLSAKPDSVTFALDETAAAAGVEVCVTSQGVYYGADPDSQEALYAHWTGAAGDNDPANGANWAATNLAGRAVANAVLTTDTTVYLHDAANIIKAPASGLNVKSLVLDETSVLTLDASNWTGAAGDAIVTTTLGITPATDIINRVRVVNPRLDVVLSADGRQILTLAKSTIAWRHLKIGSDYSINSSGIFKDRPLAGYATYASPTNTFQQATVGNYTTWQNAYICKGCSRFDGWFQVTDAQAGTWNVTQYYDDYMALAIDGDWKVVNTTYTTEAHATFEMTAGWHHFTLIGGDTAGGYGYFGSNASALVIQINGAETLVPFDERTFTFEDPCAYVAGDFAPAAVGEVPSVTCDVAADCRLVLDPATTHLTLMRAPSFEVGAKIALAAKYAEATTGSFTLMTWESGTIDTYGAALNDLFDATSAKGANPTVTVVTNDDGSGALRLTLDPSLDPAAAHWVGSVDNDCTKAANWRCTNAAGETVEAVPGWGTDVYIDADACNLNVPAGTEFPYGTLTIADTVTLAADCDWSGLDNRLTWLAGKTIDVNGHALTLAAAYDLAAGTVTSSAEGGSCRLVVPEGAYIVNTGLAFTGSVAFVKDGPGTLRAEMADQTYTGGTIAAAGLLTSRATTGDVNWSPWNRKMFGPRGAAITVNAGAVFDTAGNRDYRGFALTLAGGTLRNSGADMDGTWAGIGDLTLTADSSFEMQKTTVQNGTPVIELNGHTLDVRLTDGKYWQMTEATTFRNGTVRVRNQNGEVGTGMVQNGADITAESVDFDIGARLEFYNNVTMHDFTCRYAGTWGWSAAEKTVTVTGTFHPISDYFCNVILTDGASLDLSTKTAAWSVTSLDTGNSRTFATTFAENATIKLDTGTRQLKSGDKVISWTTAPTGVKFRPAKTGSAYTFCVRDDGLYVYAGLTVFLR